MTKPLDSSVNQRFSSRLGLLLSAIGIAVGTGNIWRFPRIAAQNGGEDGAGAFLIAWATFLFLWSIPLIIAEYTLGRKYRSGVVGVFISTVGKKFAWMGAFVAFVATAITFFYTVIVGWCIYYFVYTLTHSLPATNADSIAIWNTFQNSAWPYVTHFCAVGLGALAIWKGVRSIEKVNKILIPVLLVIVFISVIRALTLNGAWEGVNYLFSTNWSQLREPKIWMAALTQNAFDTGAGWGLFLTYAAYMKSSHGTVKNAFITGIGNNIVSLLAALMIFGTVFSVLHFEMGMNDGEVLNVMKTSGPASTGLTFIWMPQLFARMFMGGPLSILFFLGLVFAGFSSLIAQLELPTRVFIDTGMKRSKAILIVVGLVYLLGIPSARNLNFLSNQDFVWGGALLISGAFMAFAVIKYGVRKILEEYVVVSNDWQLTYGWGVVIKYFIPFAATLLLFWWLFLSATEFAKGQWYNPFNAFSVMTCLAQWFVMTALFLGYNKRIARYTSHLNE